MTNKTTKRVLFTSAISMLLCVSMLIGTTFAWFTDSVTSTNNIIKSGNLDVEFEYWNGTEWTDVSGKADILTNTLWEPGVTEIAYLRVANAGSLALKYQLGVNIVSEKEGTNVAGETFKLSDSLMFGMIEDKNGETGAFTNDDNGRAAAIAALSDVKKISAGYTKEAEMASGADKKYFALVVYMPTTVTNEANYKTSEDSSDPDKYRPQIDLGLNVFATQLASERDDFGNNYDDAAWVVANADHTAANAAELNTALAEGGLIALVDDIEGDVTLDDIADDAILNFAGNTINGTVTVAEGQSITINGNGGVSAEGSAPAVKVGKATDVTIAGGTYTSESGAAVAIANTKTDVPMSLTIEEGATITAPTLIGLDVMNGYAGADIVINGGTFTATSSGSYVRPINVEGGKITVNGGTFEAPNATSYCYFFNIGEKYNTATKTYDVGNVTINGGTFKSDADYCYVVYGSFNTSYTANRTPGSVTINGGTFDLSGTYATLVNAGAHVIVNDCTYTAPNALNVFNGSLNNATDRRIEVKGGNYTLRTNGSFVSSSYKDYITITGGNIQY